MAMALAPRASQVAIWILFWFMRILRSRMDAGDVMACLLLVKWRNEKPMNAMTLMPVFFSMSDTSALWKSL